MSKIFQSKSIRQGIRIVLFSLFLLSLSSILQAFDFSPPFRDVQAWIDNNCVRYKVFDPSRGIWKEGISCSGGSYPSNLNINDGVVTWIDNNCVQLAVYDPISGTWKYGIRCSGSSYPSNLTNVDGVVAWINDNCVEYAVYDPISSTWKYGIRCSGNAYPLNLTNNNGVVAWINDNCVESTVFDPISGTWKNGTRCSGFSYPSYLINADGVVAWLDDPLLDDHCVQYTVYDPKLYSWKYNIECFGSEEPYALSIANSTVSYWMNGQPYTRGYDYNFGNWYDSPTKPLAYFFTSPVWGSGEYWVHFNDISLGASSYSWDFDDGTGSYQQSPVHSFNYGSFSVTQHITGPGGYDYFTKTIKTDSIAPTGSITINNGDPNTPSTSVTLTLSASDNSGTVSLMRFSNDNFTWSGWETYATSRIWTLTSGTGIKTVYVQFQDPIGNTSGSYSDNIELVLFPSINLLSPNGGETWDLGTTRNITWNYFGIADTELVRLVLVKNDSDLGTIADNIPISAGSYTWTVGQYNGGTATTGYDYKIKIETMSGSFTDQSASDFSIINPSITLLSPNGGEILFTNSTKNITWESTDITGNLKIEYSTNNGTSWTAITSSTSDDGSFDWTVPDTPSIECLIRISEIDGYPTDSSDAVFSIAIPLSFTAFPDFNEDGIGDIIWRYYNTGGYNAVWLMGTGSNIDPISDARNDPRSVDLPAATFLDWKLCGAGDFNGDNKFDLVWRHMNNGQNAVWYMDGVTQIEVAWLPAETDLNWKLCGTGDFNGDGKVDLVWRNITNGQNAVWYLDGVNKIGDTAWLPTAPILDWKLCGTGDFNVDRKVDLLWRNASDGNNAVWFMDGINRIGVAFLPTASFLDWKIYGTGDFNGDSKVDIVWRKMGYNQILWTTKI